MFDTLSDKLQGALERKAKMESIDWKRMHDLGQLIRLDTVYHVIGCITEAVREEVSPEQMGRIKRRANVLTAPMLRVV